MKKYKKLVKNLIICIAILVIVFITFIMLPTNRLLISFYNEKRNYKIKKFPENSYFLFMDYDGVIENYSIYRAIHNFVYNEIPDYYIKFKDLNEKELSNYYNLHKHRISRVLGISSKEDFNIFVNALSTLNSNKLVLEKYIINDNTKPEDTDDIYKVVLLVKYENNENIGFYLEIPKEKYNIFKTPVAFNANVLEKDMDYEEVINEYESYDNDIGRGE